LHARKLGLLWLSICGLLPFLLFLGCEDHPAAEESSVSSDRNGVLFDAHFTGTITGQVIWNGEAPIVEHFVAPVSPQVEQSWGEWLKWPNPNAPVVDRRSKGVGNAVVFLRGVDPEKAKPWNHLPVCVEQRDYQLHVLQGGADSQVGFVRRGDAVAMVSRQDAFHSLHAGGAAFFTLAFPDRDEPLARKLNQSGVVELTSAAGYFWMRAYLFVDEHPYYCRTDATGRFALDQVPAGNYELVCWVPNWHKHGHDRDPETMRFSRWYFATPLELTRAVDVKVGGTSEVDFSVSTDAFAPQ
jgi:hypothetical protein